MQPTVAAWAALAVVSTLCPLTMSYKVEALPDSFAVLGEGPHWDVARQSLFYVDIDAPALYRYDYKQNKTYRATIEGEELAGFVVPIAGNPQEFAVGCGRRVVIVNWDGIATVAKVVRTLFEVQAEYEANRFNDAKADPRGRLFAGTMRYIGNEFEHRHGELFRWEQGGKLAVVKGDVGISNGLAWDEQANKFYYIDTTDYEVKSYDYNFETGVATNPKVIFNLRRTSPKDHLLPDGMTIDTEGNLYVATFNGSTIYKLDPRTGKVLLEIKLPTKQITSVAFGGPNLDILFVTTAAKFEQPPPAGTTYRVTGLNARGYAGVELKI